MAMVRLTAIEDNFDVQRTGERDGKSGSRVLWWIFLVGGINLSNRLSTAMHL